MVQLLNLVIPILAAPALHNSGFAVSTIYQSLLHFRALSGPSQQLSARLLTVPSMYVVLAGSADLA